MDRRAVLLASSAIIQDILTRTSGSASLAFFYCDFREDQTKNRCGLLSTAGPSCGYYDAYCIILSAFYAAHDRGSQYSSGIELRRCFQGMI